MNIHPDVVSTGSAQFPDRGAEVDLDPAGWRESPGLGEATAAQSGEIGIAVASRVVGVLVVTARPRRISAAAIAQRATGRAAGRSRGPAKSSG